MKADTGFKIMMLGVLILYAAIIAGVGYGCYACFDGIVLATGIWQFVRLLGGGILGLMLVLAVVFWIFLFICLIREFPGSTRPVTDEEAAQFDEFLKRMEEKKKK